MKVKESNKPHLKSNRSHLKSININIKGKPRKVNDTKC